MEALSHDEAVMMDDGQEEGPVAEQPRPLGSIRSPKTRSLSDSGGTPSKLSPSPLIVEASRRTSKDDNHIRDYTPVPTTPNRTGFTPRGLSIHMIPQRDGSTTSPVPTQVTAFTKPAPLSPKLEQIYASPTNILPRRSRGLDFSRAATSLHHSTLAESSPDSSPTIGGRAVNIPARRSNDYGATEQSSTSLWSVMGNQERVHVSSSLGSAHPAISDSSSSEDDDLMDEDPEDMYLSTPQASRTGLPSGISGGFGSPAMNSLISFQQRQRPRKQPKKKLRGPLGLGFGTSISAMSKSPPSKEMPMSHSRRESISWQANQLHISSTEEERMSGESINSVMSTPTSKRQTIMRQVATRRGNLMVGSVINAVKSTCTDIHVSPRQKTLLVSSTLCSRKAPLWRQRSAERLRSSARFVRVIWTLSLAFRQRIPRPTSPTRM